MPKTDRGDFAGKIALVTGASRGIGLAIARALAEEGAHVILSSRKAEACADAAAEIRASGGSAEGVACHIGEIDQIEALYATLAKTHGRLDLLVNNAATNPYFGPVYDTDLGAFQKSADVNIRGYFFMSAKAVKLMTGHGGAILNVASIDAIVPGESRGIYSITKAAIVAITKSFAKDCAPLGIRVNALLPGPTDTKFAAALVHHPDPAFRARTTGRVPLGRVAQPDEMVGAALYLLSPAASYTTGASLVVDGGYLVS